MALFFALLSLSLSTRYAAIGFVHLLCRPHSEPSRERGSLLPFVEREERGRARADSLVANGVRSSSGTRRHSNRAHVCCWSVSELNHAIVVIGRPSASAVAWCKRTEHILLGLVSRR